MFYCPLKSPLLLYNASVCGFISYPADVVLAFCGDGLIDDFLAADAQENFLHFVDEALQVWHEQIKPTIIRAA